jgi:hypothetical protein
MEAAASAPEQVMEKVKALLEQGQRLEARTLLTQLYLRSSGSTRDQVRKVLDAINEELVFNPWCLEGAKVHVVKRGETLSSIAKSYGTNAGLIARVNAIRPPYLIREKQQLKILAGQPAILVQKSSFTLTLFMGGAYIKEYPVAIGEGNKTPSGVFTTETCLVKPDWYPPGGGLIRYGEEGHLLGERWIGFQNVPAAQGLGIHGTNDPQSIGKKCSNGCVRMLNDDVMELYDFVVPGIKVVIVE